MHDPVNTLARILRTNPSVLLTIQQKMDMLTGQEGVLEDVVRQNEITVDNTLAGLGLSRNDSAGTVRKALIERLSHFDSHLYDMLGKPDLRVMSKTCEKLCDVVWQVYTPPEGLFLKHEKIAQMLEKYPPQNILDHFGYPDVRTLLDKEGIASVMASLRFTQSTEWMHQFFDIAYSDVTPDDFESRKVDLIILDTKWLEVAERFLEKKYHNVSHLKEFGVVFVIPIKIDTPGETLRLFTLMLHYMHEVPFYAGLFRYHMRQPNFAEAFKSLLRGDVSGEPLPDHGKISWRVVQRYLAKDNPDDFRLKEPHVNPEADHWYRAEKDLGRLSRILRNGYQDDHGSLDLGWWSGLDFSGDFFKNDGGEELVSFDLVDLVMSLVQKNQIKYLYHQQEALWNRIFIEYMGRERLEQLIEKNLTKGFIVL